VAVAFQTGSGAFAWGYCGGAGEWSALFSVDDIADYQSGVVTAVLAVSPVVLSLCQRIICEYFQATAHSVFAADSVSGSGRHLVEPMA